MIQGICSAWCDPRTVLDNDSGNDDSYSDKDGIKSIDTLYYEHLRHFNITMQEGR